MHYGCHGQTEGVHDDASAAVEWLRERLPALTSGRVLDVGCGDGRLTPRGAVGLDLDAARLAAARARSALVVRADAKALPFADRSFDTVCAHRILNDTGDIEGALAEMARVLRDGGRLLVFTRARMAEGDRLDRWNGETRLGRRFAEVRSEVPAADERAALFVASRPRRS